MHVFRDLSRPSKNVVSQLFSKYCQIYINLRLKVVRTSTAHKKTGCFMLTNKLFSSRTLIAVHNGLGQIHGIFTFEDIVQYRFHEILFKCK